MPRRIQTVSHQDSGGPPADGYMDRIVKYVPSDVVAAWTAVMAAVKGAGASVPADKVLWGCFAFGVVFTPLWVLYQTPGKSRALTQAIVATVAFAVWVFAIGAPFSSLSFYNGLYGTLAIIAFTLISGFIVPKEQ